MGALNKAIVKLPAIAPARGCGEDNVGVNAVVSFPSPPSKSTMRPKTFKSDETSSLMSEGVRLLELVG